MTTTERSVEEIVEEILDIISDVKDVTKEDVWTVHELRNEFTKLLTAERQRCEEIVLKGERRRIIEQIRDERDTYWKERVLKAEPKDRHSSNFESEMYDRGYNHGKADYKRSIEKITNKDNLK